MNSLEALTVFFGWCTVINFGFMVLVFLLVATMRGAMARMHSGIFGVNEAELPRIYFQYLANYQTAILVLNLAPYVALKLMT